MVLKVIAFLLVTKFDLVMRVFQALLDALHITKQSFSCRHYQVELGNEQTSNSLGTERLRLNPLHIH